MQSVTQPSSGQFLIQLANANAAGNSPMDICVLTQADMLRGRDQGLLKPIDETRLSNLQNVMPRYMNRADGKLYSVGALGWYATFIVNPELVQPLPTSWTNLWEATSPSWGIHSGGSATILDVTASTFFDGPETLDTEAGIDAVLAKIAELKPATQLWWSDEGSMQTAFENGEVVGGIYIHDVAMIMKDNGVPIESIFPKEGAVHGFGSWCVPASSEISEATLAYLNWGPHPRRRNCWSGICPPRRSCRANP